MTEALSHDFTYTYDEYITAMNLFYRRDLNSYAVCASVALVPLLLFFFLPFTDAAIINCIFLPIFVLTYIVVRTNTLRRTFLQSQIWQAQQAFSFDDEGLKLITEYSKSELKWKLFQKVWDTPSAYLLFFEKRRFLIIPKRVFHGVDDQMHFEGLLKSSVPHTHLLSHSKN